MNVNNPKPTVNINDIIQDYNKLNNTSIDGISVEWLAARMCTEIEALIGESCILLSSVVLKG